MKDIDTITSDVIDVAIRIHRALGPGLLESVYETVRLVIEIKSVDQINPVHAKQLLTYLRLTKQPVGLLLNFGGETMKEGIRRLVSGYDPLRASAPLREQN